VIPNRNGYTLVEVIAYLAVTGILMGVLVPFLFNITRGTKDTVDETTSIIQVQIAGTSISRDIKMAADTILADAAAGVLDNLTLQWSNEYQDIYVDHTVQYYLSGEELLRDYDGAVTTVASYISDVEFSRSGSVITVTITAAAGDVPDQIERGTYHVTVRQ